MLSAHPGLSRMEMSHKKRVRDRPLTNQRRSVRSFGTGLEYRPPKGLNRKEKSYLKITLFRLQLENCREGKNQDLIKEEDELRQRA
jgi:phage-related protein